MGAIDASPQEAPLTFVWQGLQAAFGLNGASGREMMLGALIFSVGAYVTTALSFGATAILVVLGALLFLIGAFRFSLRLVMN